MKAYQIVVPDHADKEYRDAFNYYESKQSGLGDEFESEITILLNLISDNPLLFQRKYKHYREAIVNRFPFFIVYEIVHEQIIVHSFFHMSRNPKVKYLKR